MKENKKPKGLLVISIIFITLGTVLVLLSFHKEVLDDKYKVIETKNYSTNKTNLSNGQIQVIQNIKYQGKGVFKIIFNTYSKSNTNEKVIKENTNLTITDNITEDYKVLDKIFINNNKYKIENNEVKNTDDISVQNKNNNIEITIPNKLATKENEITIFIELKSREKNHKLYTNKDCYFSINPNSDNSYYTKDGNQSYIVYGKGYIELK